MNEDKSFMDSRTLVAIAMVAAVWFGWQTYLAKKYPQTVAPTETAVAVNAPAAAGTASSATAVAAPGSAVQPGASTEAAPANSGAIEQLKPQISEEAQFQISSEGLAIKDLQLRKYSKRDHTPFAFAQGVPAGVFAMGFLDVGTNRFLPLHFDVQQNGQTITGIAKLGAMTVKRTIEYSAKDYSFINSVSIENPSADLSAGKLALAVQLTEKKDEEKKSSFLMGNYEHQEFFISHSEGKSDRINVSSAKEKLDKSFSGVSILAIGSQYFASSIVDKSEVIPTAKVYSDLNNEPLRAYLVYSLANTTVIPKISFKAFAGPKAHDLLLGVDQDLPEILDFGYFSAIGKILLTVLRSFNKIFDNWGVSIVFLTLVVRMLVLPVNITSYRSMKRMQKIQPQMQSLRERYKEDPTALQRETMALMKREKVNPVGSCLPMLLQMPIFFALFSVLGHSIEIYQAPFFGWISDLSLKDPYFILPALVGIIFFIQQKITPTTMDPAQAKVMQFMPIFFSVMMVSLPSGLNLYTFISTLFGVTQQRIFMRDRQKETNIQPVKA